MKLVTFNIRLDWGRDGMNNFSNRKALILDTIRQEEPDILCFQEVLPHVAAWLRQNLTSYYILGCPRGEVNDDEQTCIAYRFDRFEALRMEAYWLSPTPQVPGSRYPEQSCCPRICTEVVLRDFRHGKAFRLTNTHLDHEGSLARLLAARQIIEKRRSQTFLSEIPDILVGDMNAVPESPEIELFCRVYQNFTADIGPTYHGFGSADPIHIDYIFASRELSCSRIEKWTHWSNGVWLSDHYPVCAEIQL